MASGGIIGAVTTVLLVEDEPDLLGTLDYRLRREGYGTVLAPTGRAALDALAAEPVPDVVLLDLMLPDMSGLDVCRAIRRDPRTEAVPVLMLTARAEELDRVAGFEVGADDYVCKPFSVRELLLRIEARLRAARRAPEDGAGDAVVFGRLRLEPSQHRALVDGGEIVLTALEFRLLRALLGQPGVVHSRERLLEDVWGITADVTTRTVDTHVKRLRQKLGPCADYVETLRGVGYRWTARPGEGSGAGGRGRDGAPP